MEKPKPLPPEVTSIYNEDQEAWSPAMTDILFAQLNNNFKALEEKIEVLFQSKPGPRPPATPSGSGDKIIHKGGVTIRG